VKDTTYRPISIATSNPSQIGNTLSPVPSTASTSALTSRFGLSGLFRGSSHPTEPSLPLARSVSAPEGAQPTLEDSVLVPSPNATGTQPINVIRSPQLDILDPARSPESIHTVVPNTPQVAISQSLEHSYPPGSSPDISTFHHVVKQDAVQDISAPGGWGVPSWLRNPSRKLFSYGGDSGVSEVYESAKPDRSLSTLGSVVSPNSALEGRASLDGENQLGFSMMEAPQENNTVLDPLIGEKFRTYFALDEKEELLACESYLLCQIVTNNVSTFYKTFLGTFSAFCLSLDVSISQLTISVSDPPNLYERRWLANQIVKGCQY